VNTFFAVATNTRLSIYKNYLLHEGTIKFRPEIDTLSQIPILWFIQRSFDRGI